MRVGKLQEQDAILDGCTFAFVPLFRLVLRYFDPEQGLLRNTGKCTRFSHNVYYVKNRMRWEALREMSMFLIDVLCS